MIEKMENSTVSKKNKKVSTYIPHELAISILLKLPLKAFKRFTCVKKSWSRLVDNEDFMSMYLNNFLSNKRFCYKDDTCLTIEASPPDYKNFLYLLSGERFESKVKLDWPPQFEDNRAIIILDSPVNGTLCLHQGDTKIVLWNPTTDELQVLPPSPLESPLPSYNMAVLRLHGFGYDRVRDDYKVLRHVAYITPVARFEGYIPPHVSVWEIYSRRSNSWRKLDLDMPSGYASTLGVRVQVNGVCHWWDVEEKSIISFDLSNELFFTTPLPPDNIDDGFNYGWMGRPERCIVALNGSIALIATYGMYTFHISILGELGMKESWTKLFVADPKLHIRSPIGAGNRGDIFFITFDYELFCYDLRTRTVEKLGIDWHELSSQAVLYKEILLSVKGRIGL